MTIQLLPIALAVVTLLAVLSFGLLRVVACAASKVIDWFLA